jgi:hypothetical protein
MASDRLNSQLCSSSDCPNPDVHSRLARIETKLDDFLPTVRSYIDKTDALDKNVQRVNRKLSYFAGIFAAIMFLVSFLGSKIREALL